MGAKGGDSDWYGYCVDDPVNRVGGFRKPASMDAGSVWA